MTMKNLKKGMVVLNKINKEQYEICAVSEGKAEAVKMVTPGDEVIEITEQNAICFKMLFCPEGPTGFTVKDGCVVSPTGVAVEMGEIKAIKVLADTNSCLVFLAEDKDAEDGNKRTRVMAYYPRHDSFCQECSGLSENPLEIQATGDILIIVSDTEKTIMVPAETEGNPDVEKKVCDMNVILQISKKDGYVGIIDEDVIPRGKFVAKQTVTDDDITTTDVLLLSDTIVDEDGYLKTMESGGLLTVVRISDIYDDVEERTRTTVDLRESVMISAEVQSAEFDTEATKSLLVRTDKEIVFMNTGYDPVVINNPSALAKIPAEFKYLVASQVKNNFFRLSLADKDLRVLMIKSENTTDRGTVVTVESASE